MIYHIFIEYFVYFSVFFFHQNKKKSRTLVNAERISRADWDITKNETSCHWNEGIRLNVNQRKKQKSFYHNRDQQLINVGTNNCQCAISLI